MTDNVRIRNQVNPPERVVRNKWGKKPGWKIYFKKDGNSMLLFSGLQRHIAFVRCNTLKRIYNDWRGKFIITR